ncbi:MAG TPA: DegV family protein [Clostridia bacterium]|nr:DegV family protein [Clostridia bacterium]
MFVIRTLEYLRKGGRIGLVEGVLGTMLQLKPVIFVNDDGIYQTLVKARGYANAIECMLREIAERFGRTRVKLAVVHGSAQPEAEGLMGRLQSALNVAESYILQVSPVLGAHTGPSLVGIIACEA